MATVDVAAGGTWHLPHTASQLSRRGMLGIVASTTPLHRLRTRAPFPRRRYRPLVLPWYVRVGRTDSPDLAWRRACGQAIERRLRHRGADVSLIYSHFALESLQARAKNAGVPLMVLERASMHGRDEKTLRGTLSEESEEILRREELEYELADLVLVPSSRNLESLVRWGVPETKIRVVPLGVDLERFTVPEGGRSDGPCRIVTVGNLGISKGTDTLISAFDKLPSAEFELHLVGPTSAEVDRMLYDRPAVAGRVFRHGRLRQTELVGVLQSCDIFCLPSLYEGMSLAVLEGMACGLDAIVSPVAGYSEDASPALSLASGVADFAEHLSSVSACRLADPIAAQMRAREFARGFSWWAYGDRLSRLLGLELGRQR